MPSLRWTYSTTLAAAIPATCPGGVTDSGRITAVESGNVRLRPLWLSFAIGMDRGDANVSWQVVKLSPSAAPFAGIYVGKS